MNLKNYFAFRITKLLIIFDAVALRSSFRIRRTRMTAPLSAVRRQRLAHQKEQKKIRINLTLSTVHSGKTLESLLRAEKKIKVGQFSVRPRILRLLLLNLFQQKQLFISKKYLCKMLVEFSLLKFFHIICKIFLRYYGIYLSHLQILNNKIIAFVCILFYLNLLYVRFLCRFFFLNC